MLYVIAKQFVFIKLCNKNIKHKTSKRKTGKTATTNSTTVKLSNSGKPIMRTTSLWKEQTIQEDLCIWIITSIII